MLLGGFVQRDIRPPKSSKSDDRYALFLAGVSTIPWAGAILAEALKRRWPSRFEKAHKAWLSEITTQSNQSARDLSTIRKIEEGSNANGHYRRFGDGVLEVEAQVCIDLDNGTALSVAFPAAFSRAPIVQTFDESHGLKPTKVTPNGFTFTLKNGVYRDTIIFRYRAFGRWH